MAKLSRKLVLLHAYNLWSILGCVVQIAAGEAITTHFGASPGVGALAVVVAMLLQLVSMYIAVRDWPENHPLLSVALEQEYARPTLVHSQTEITDGEASQRQGNP